MNKLMLGIENLDGVLIVDSRKVAKKLGVRHKDLLEKVSGYMDRFHSAEVSAQFYIQSTYKDRSGKSNKNYLITEMGIAQLIGSYSSAVKRAFDLNVEYIQEFKIMKDSLNKINDVLIEEKDEKKVASKVKEVMAEHNNEMKVLKGHFEFAKQMIDEQDKKIKALDGVANLFSSMKDGQLPFSLTYEQARKINRASWKVMQDKKTIKPSDGAYYFKDKNGYTIPLPDED